MMEAMKSMSDSAQAIKFQAALRNAMQSRREIETEFAEIDARIRDAIMNGDDKRMTDLQRRKRELPVAYVTASHAERKLADRIHGEARANAEARLTKATAELEAQKEAFESLQQRHKREYEEAAQALRESEIAKGVAQGDFMGANNTLTGSQEGFKRALGRIAEKF
jgi:hypothetical protein